ncbi:MAG: Ig-like domain-containing protein, partial [Deltaproteobacteria bacterium]|nr:Ig-like domain-containing protein [Deltaproteobacteria bacterium]
MLTGRCVGRCGVGVLLMGAFLWASWGCGGASKSTKTAPKVAKKKTRSKKGSAGGLVFTLTGGQEEGDANKKAKVAKGRSLTLAEQEAILTRLPAMDGPMKKAFALRGGSLPPPRTGKTIAGVFPPPEKPMVPDKAATGALQVRRASPEGDVGLAPNLSVTFSQPMVAVTSHADTVAQGVPVKLKPEVKGVWRWVGTKTLLFQPKPRFPMATRFSAEVAAGTPSATGGKLDAAHQWSFSTPAPQLQGYSPSGGSQRRDVLLYARFDQRIDAKAVLASIQLMAGGDSFPLRLAHAEEIV